MVLSIDLRNVPSESTSSGLLRGGLFGGSRDIVDTVQLLWQAADDPRVVGLFVDIGDESAGLARVQELRQAIAHFRGKGKFAVGFAESLGSGGTHLADYYLASSLEQIWLQPSGGFAVAGIAVETPFIKTGLDKLGVQIEGGKRYEYKSAPDTFLETGYTRPARENLQQLLDSLYGQFVGDVARERHIEPAQAAPADRCRAVRFGAGATGKPGRQGRLSQRRAGRGRDARRQNPRSHHARRLRRRRGAAQAARRGRGAGAGERRHRVRSGQRQPARRRRRGAGRGRGRRARPGGQGQGSARHRAAHRFARRHLPRRRCHRRRRRPRPLGRQAGDRLDGRRRGVGRLPRRHSRRRHRGPAHHHHRLDRRVQHLAGGIGAAGLARHQGRAAGDRHQCRHVFALPGADAGAERRGRARARHDLCRVHPPGRRSPQARRRQARCGGARPRASPAPTPSRPA